MIQPLVVVTICIKSLTDKYKVLQSGRTSSWNTTQVPTAQAQHMDYDQDRHRVRLQQQEIANQRAREAEKIRKEKEEAERKRKNNVAKSKQPSNSNTLGSVGGEKASGGEGYNPLQPWSSSSGGGYRYVKLDSMLCKPIWQLVVLNLFHPDLRGVRYGEGEGRSSVGRRVLRVTCTAILFEKGMCEMTEWVGPPGPLTPEQRIALSLRSKLFEVCSKREWLASAAAWAC